MEGALDTISLIDVLEMLHGNRGTGRLYVEIDRLPLEIEFSQGEISSASILDWHGLEAIATFPLHPKFGRFKFVGSSENKNAMLPFKNLVGEWARLNDQWSRFLTVIDSPSRVLDTPNPSGQTGIFQGGRSIRGAAKQWKVPLIIAAERVWSALNDGELSKVRRYAWYGLKIRHPSRRRKKLDETKAGDITRQLDGSKNLGELIQEGLSIHRLRKYLIEEIAEGNVHFQGQGWVLRDLLWELEQDPSNTTIH